MHGEGLVRSSKHVRYRIVLTVVKHDHGPRHGSDRVDALRLLRYEPPRIWVGAHLDGGGTASERRISKSPSDSSTKSPETAAKELV